MYIPTKRHAPHRAEQQRRHTELVERYEARKRKAEPQRRPPRERERGRSTHDRMRDIDRPLWFLRDSDQES